MLFYKQWLANSIDYKIVRFYLNKKSLRHNPHQHELIENEISGAQVKLFKFYFYERLTIRTKKLTCLPSPVTN